VIQMQIAFALLYKKSMMIGIAVAIIVLQKQAPYQFNCISKVHSGMIVVINPYHIWCLSLQNQ
jgi:hypothetical protein